MTGQNDIMGKKVAVVTVTRRLPCNAWDFEAKVFATSERAEKWINEQIDVICKENGLERAVATALDDWHVEVDADSAYQFDMQEECVY
jgi:hypothetical protein